MWKVKDAFSDVEEECGVYCQTLPWYRDRIILFNFILFFCSYSALIVQHIQLSDSPTLRLPRCPAYRLSPPLPLRLVFAAFLIMSTCLFEALNDTQAARGPQDFTSYRVPGSAYSLTRLIAPHRAPPPRHPRLPLLINLLLHAQLILVSCRRAFHVQK